MNQRVRTILEEARKLTTEERQELFDLLDTEFAGDKADGSFEEVEAAWIEEVRKRIAQSERGETAPVEFDEALARARRRLR